MYPNGYDIAWFATDDAGNVGAFISAGMGPIPVSALVGSEEDVLDFETKLKVGSTKRGGYKLHTDVPRPDDFIELAERGFFVFDWDGGEYTLVASPLNPLSLEKLGVFADRVRATLVPTDLSLTNAIGVGALKACVLPTR